MRTEMDGCKVSSPEQRNTVGATAGIASSVCVRVRVCRAFSVQAEGRCNANANDRQTVPLESRTLGLEMPESFWSVAQSVSTCTHT